jgi:cell division septation protein DedD
MNDRIVVALVLSLVALPGAAAQAPAPPAASTPRADTLAMLMRRAQRLVNDGAGTEGRALVDSVLETTEPRSDEEGEVLFWRATLAESWERAQRDYLRLMLEHERSPRAGDAMLRLAQGEVARGDREAAERYLERLAREAPGSAARAEGGLWHGRLLLERGLRNEGCSILRGTRSLVRPGALELENQFEYLINQCPAEVAATDSATSAPVTQAQAPPPPVASEPAPVTPAPAPTQPPVSPSPRTEGVAPAGWSVQVAAVSTEAEANALVRRLAERGYEARVDGAAAPFRVRFGRYPTRAAAASAMEAYRTKERADAFLVQVPRG